MAEPPQPPSNAAVEPFELVCACQNLMLETDVLESRFRTMFDYLLKELPRLTPEVGVERMRKMQSQMIKARDMHVVPASGLESGVELRPATKVTDNLNDMPALAAVPATLRPVTQARVKKVHAFAMAMVNDALSKQTPLHKITAAAIAKEIAPQMGESVEKVAKFISNGYVDLDSIKAAAAMGNVSLPPPDSGGVSALSGRRVYGTIEEYMAAQTIRQSPFSTLEQSFCIAYETSAQSSADCSQTEFPESIRCRR